MNKIWFKRYLLSLLLLLSFSCTTNGANSSFNNDNFDSTAVVETLLSNIEFRVENYNVDTLDDYQASSEFINRHIKGNNAFQINYNNPFVNDAEIDYYILDTLIKDAEIKVIIILEQANDKSIGSSVIALILNADDSFRSTTALALIQENKAWNIYWRSYIENDTLHRLSIGMNKDDTTLTRFVLNGFKDIELINSEP